MLKYGKLRRLNRLLYKTQKHIHRKFITRPQNKIQHFANINQRHQTEKTKKETKSKNENSISLPDDSVRVEVPKMGGGNDNRQEGGQHTPGEQAELSK